MPLRTRLVLVALSAILMVAGLLTATGWIARYAADERLQDMATSHNDALWQQIISSQLDRMQAAMFGLSRNGSAIRALEQGNRNGLMDSVRPTYNRLSTSHIITQLAIADTDGATMFSAPKTRSEAPLSPILLEVAGTGKVKRGLLKDPDNQLIAFLAFPLYARQVLAGIGLFVQDLQTSLEIFSRYDHTEAFILHADGSPAYATNPEMLSRLTLTLPQLGQSTLANTKLGSNIYAVTISPLTDITGAPQAHLVSIKDHTTAYAHQQMITRLAYSMIIMVLILSLTGLSWYTYRLLSPLRAAIADLHTPTENEGSKAQPTAETDLTARLTPLAGATAANEITALTTELVTADSPDDIPPVPALTSGPQDAVALDPQTINALKTLCPDDSESFLQELIAPFLQETSAQLADLNRAVEAADTDTLDYTAHALKGSCTYIGAQNMATLCQSLQALSQQPITPMADIIAAIEQLTAEFDRVRHALEAEIRQIENNASYTPAEVPRRF